MMNLGATSHQDSEEAAVLQYLQHSQHSGSHSSSRSKDHLSGDHFPVRKKSTKSAFLLKFKSFHASSPLPGGSTLVDPCCLGSLSPDFRFVALLAQSGTLCILPFRNDTDALGQSSSSFSLQTDVKM